LDSYGFSGSLILIDIFLEVQNPMIPKTADFDRSQVVVVVSGGLNEKWLKSLSL